MKTIKQTIYKKLGWLGIGLCGLCCALPVIGVAIGATSLALIATYIEKVGLAALVLALFFFWIGKYKKTKAKTCTTSCHAACDCKPAHTSE